MKKIEERIENYLENADMLLRITNLEKIHLPGLRRMVFKGVEISAYLDWLHEDGVIGDDFYDGEDDRLQRKIVLLIEKQKQIENA